MSTDVQLFRINPDTHESKVVNEVDFEKLGLQERRDIQEWIAAHPGILGNDLLIISKEFSGFDRTSERLDLLAVDRAAKLGCHRNKTGRHRCGCPLAGHQVCKLSQPRQYG